MSTFDRENPAPPPGMVLAGPRVAYEWIEGEPAPHHAGVAPAGRCLQVWHWCDHSVWRAKAVAEGRAVVEDLLSPRWSPSAASLHDLIAADPLHLEPSVYWPSCCGLHGWIRTGVWTDA